MAPIPSSVCCPRVFRVLQASCLVLVCAVGLYWLTAADPVEADEDPLRDPSAFAALDDEIERSRALFTEASKVLTHVRCMNCHPSGDSPMQLDGREHIPPVHRGAEGEGITVMLCESCHQSSNVEHARIPGAPHWRLAPLSMAWQGKTLTEICEQIKDAERNGGRTLEEIHHHVSEDALVKWGWDPGPGRDPAPGDQKTFAALVEAWIATGAHCPTAPPSTDHSPDEENAP